MRDAATQLERFRRRHPRCTVAGADLVRPTIGLVLAASLLAAGGAAVALAAGGDAWHAAAFVAPALLLLAAGLRVGRRALGALRLSAAHRAAGRLCYAVAERSCLLVDATGRSIEIDLVDVSRLALDEGEVELVLEGEHRGLAYAALFDLFDGAHPGPSARGYYAAMARRLRPLRASALEQQDFEALHASVPAPALRDGA